MPRRRDFDIEPIDDPEPIVRSLAVMVLAGAALLIMLAIGAVAVALMFMVPLPVVRQTVEVPVPTVAPAFPPSLSPSADLTESMSSLAGLVASYMFDDALWFVALRDPATVTADQLTAALAGLIFRLDRFTKQAATNPGAVDPGLDVCAKIARGVAARSSQRQQIALDLAQACETYQASGNLQPLNDALLPFAEFLPQ